MLSIIKKDLFTKKGFAHTEKRLLIIKVIIMLTHTKQSHGKQPRQILTANSSGEFLQQKATANSHGKKATANSCGKFPQQKAKANSWRQMKFHVSPFNLR